MILIRKKEHVALFPELILRSYCSPSAVFLHHGHLISHGVYQMLYNNQINAHALIGQSAMGYCADKPTEKSRVF